MASSHCTVLTPVADRFALSHIVISVLFLLIMQLLLLFVLCAWEEVQKFKMT